MDIKAKDKLGNEYIVEMQVTDKLGFAKRIVYYSAKSYSAQLNSSEDYFTLKPIIFIGILNFEFLEGKNYLSQHLILDTATNEHKLKDVDFNFIELPKFNKTEKELQTLVEKWVYFIKNAESLTVIPAGLDDEGLESAYTEADKHLWKKEDLEAYEYARMRETDEKAEKMLVEEKAKLSKQLENTQNGISKGYDNEIISDITGLTVEQIEQLRQETK